MTNKCIVHGCINCKDEGEFIGDICAPCYGMITEGNASQPSNNFIYNLQVKINELEDEINELEDEIKSLESTIMELNED
jgi:hypothetical protein